MTNTNTNINVKTEMSGIEFNKSYENVKFYKFLNRSLTTPYFRYQLGLNSETLPFYLNPSNETLKGGFYFCEESECHRFWSELFLHKVALVTIPDDAHVHIEKYQFKSDKFILTEITDYNDVPDKFWIDILRNRQIYIENNRDRFFGNNLRTNGSVLKYIKNQTIDICEMAVKQYGPSLEFVQKDFFTKKICKLAFQEDIYSVKKAKNTIKMYELGDDFFDGFCKPSYGGELCNESCDK